MPKSYLPSHNEVEEALNSAFPILPHVDFEAYVNNAPYRVGVNLSYPAELRERISAAIISYLLQNKSIDYTRKKYLSPFEEDPGGDKRLDRSLRRVSLTEMGLRHDAIVEANNEHDRDVCLGEIVRDLTISRIPPSIRSAFSLADRGMIYESLVVIRMNLEQLVWASSISRLEERDSIVGMSVTKSIGKAAKEYAGVGKFYGWLSDHAHWAYDAHVKVISAENGQSITRIANSEFKAIAYAALCVFTNIFIAIIENIYKEIIFVDMFKKKKEILGLNRAYDCCGNILKIREVLSDNEDIEILLNISRG